MQTRVHLGEMANNDIVNAALKSLPNETGGILVGYREDADIVVTHAIVITPTTRSGHRYTRGRETAEIALQLYLDGRETEDPTGYVGEWHSHPGPAKPSKIDIAAIKTLAKQAQSPLALLVVSPSIRSTITAMVAAPSRRQGVRAAQAHIVCIPTSPPRAPDGLFEQRNVAGVNQPDHAKSDRVKNKEMADD